MKLKVEYNPEKCIGVFRCTKVAPFLFKEEGEKALLEGNTTIDGWQIRTIECNEEEAEQIIEAAKQCPVNVIHVTNEATGEKLVDSKLKILSTVKEIEAHYDDAKEFVLDPKGYFLIRIVPEEETIEVAFCGDKNQVEAKITGKNPTEIYQTILREKIIDRPDHAAYLGRELQKAYTALKLGLEYIQDDPLRLEKPKTI